MAISALVGAVAFAALGYWLSRRGHHWPTYICFIIVGLFLTGTPVGSVLNRAATGVLSAGMSIVSAIGH